MTTRIKSFGPGAITTADTKTQVGNDYNVPKIMNRIVGIIVTYADSGIASADPIDCIITLELDTVKGPFEIPAVQGMCLITTSGGFGALGAPVIVPLSIEGVGGAVLTVSATSSSTPTDITVGVMLE